MEIILLLMISTITFLIAKKDLKKGYILFIFLIPFEDIFIVWGYSITLVAFSVLLLVFFINKILASERILIDRKFVISLSLWLLWSTLSMFWASNVSAVLSYLKIILQIILFVIISYDICDDEELFIKSILAYVVSISILNLYAIYSYQNVNLYGRLTLSENQNPNITGRLIGVAIILSIYLMKSRKGKVFGLITFLSLASNSVGFILTSSRASWAALVISSISTNFLLMLKSKKLGLKYLALTLGLLFVMFGLIPKINIVPKDTLDRISSFGISDDISDEISGDTSNEISRDTSNEISGDLSSETSDDINSEISQKRVLDLAGRSDIWAVSVEMFKRNNPILGVGLNNFQENFMKYTQYIGNIEKEKRISFPRDPHSIYISILCELGIIGLLIFIFPLIGLIKELIKKIDYPESWVALMALIFVMVAGLMGTNQYRRYLWFVIALSLISTRIYKKQKTE